MSDLLTIGKSGVLAYQNALAGISENVVNANNAGYARRQVTMKEQAAAAGPLFLSRNSSSFNGVLGADVSRVWDQYSAQRAWSANSDSSQASTRSQWYGTVENALNDGDSGVGVKLTAIFHERQRACCQSDRRNAASEFPLRHSGCRRHDQQDRRQSCEGKRHGRDAGRQCGR